MPIRIGESRFLKETHYFSGNEAATEGAIAAGCRFYAGYPITPSSELMERMAVRLKEVGGVFIQMEDEIASISAVIGASWAGAELRAYPGTEALVCWILDYNHWWSRAYYFKRGRWA